MGNGGTAALASVTLWASRVQRQPLRPVPAKVKKIVKVHEPAFLQVVDQGRERIVRRQRTEEHQPVFHPELIRSQVVPLINCGACYSAGLKCALTNQHYGVILRELERHIYIRLETNSKRKPVGAYV